MIGRAAYLALGFGLVGQAAGAQAPLDMAAANMQLAMQICLQNYGTPDQMVPSFKQAGFTERVEDFGGGNIIHWMSDPAQTTLVNVQPGTERSFCAVSTELFGVTAAIPYTKQVLGNIYQGEVFEGGLEGGAIVRPGTPAANNQPCSGYSFIAPRRPVQIDIGNAGQDPLCIEDGTVQIMMRM